MRCDVLEFGERESKEAFQALNILPSTPAFGKSTVKYVSLDRKSLGKNEEIRRPPTNSVGSFYLKTLSSNCMCLK